MKVAMILDSGFPPDPRVENEALALSESGHEVHLFSIDYTRSLPSKQHYSYLTVYRHYGNKLLYKLSALAYTFNTYHRLLAKPIRDFLAQVSPDVVHVHDMQIAGAVFKESKKMNVPIILDLHENRPEIMREYEHVRSFLGRILIDPKRWKHYESIYIKQANKVICVTDSAINYYVSNFSVSRCKFHTVTNTIHPSFYKDVNTRGDLISVYSDKQVIIYIGHTGYRRGLLTAIEGISLIKDEFPNVKLVVLGTSKFQKHLEEKVSECKVGAYVDLLGWQDHSLFPTYISISRFGISPLHRNIHHDTTIANKLMQYMAFGKPILVSDCDAQKNLVDQFNCGLSHISENAESFAKQTRILLSNDNAYQQYAENAILVARDRQGWESFRESLHNIYSKI